MSLYDRLMPFKRVHYVPYWLGVATAYFLIQEGLLRLVGEPTLLPMRLLIAYGVIAVDVSLLVALTRVFLGTMEGLRSVLTPPTDDYGRWVEEKAKDFFSLSTWRGRIMALLWILAILAVFTFWLGWPFKSRLANVVFVVTLQPALVVFSHGSYLVFAGLSFLSKIVRYPVNTPFHMTRHPAILQLSRCYSQGTLTVMLALVWLVALFRLSPYGLTNPSLIFIGVIGFYPLAMILWSFSQIHTLMQRTKQQHLEVISKEVQAALERTQKQPSKEAAEMLATLIEIQEKVEKAHEWPIDLGAIGTLLITFAVPIANVLLSVWRETKSP